MGKKIACIGDISDHGGVISSHNQDGTLNVSGLPVVVEGAMHSCPIEGHGVTEISSIAVKSFHNGKLIVTEDSVAGCGAKIAPVDRKVYVE